MHEETNTTFPVIIVETLANFFSLSPSMLISKTFMPRKHVKPILREAIRVFMKRQSWYLVFSESVSTNCDRDCCGITYDRTDRELYEGALPWHPMFVVSALSHCEEAKQPSNSLKWTVYFFPVLFHTDVNKFRTEIPMTKQMLIIWTGNSQWFKSSSSNRSETKSCFDHWRPFWSEWWNGESVCKTPNLRGDWRRSGPERLERRNWCRANPCKA